jgi:hypothetical protein
MTIEALAFAYRIREEEYRHKPGVIYKYVDEGTLSSITIGANVNVYNYTTGNGDKSTFTTFYNKHGKKAGTYTANPEYSFGREFLEVFFGVKWKFTPR